jgi:predicted ATPase/DNA-binding SARP family transcriptional activator/tetratricopeptide (TPR) repeat protein
VRIGLLGPFLLQDDLGHSYPVTARERGLLALLALQVGRPLSREHLIDALWDAELPTNPTNALQQRVLHARRALQAVLVADDAGGDDPATVLVTVAGGYVLDVDAAAVDVQRFEADRARASSALEADELEAAHRGFQAALDHFRGTALLDVAAPWAAAEAARLEELRLLTVEDRIEVELRLGRHRDLVAELEQLTDRHPLRERLRGQHLRALAAAGRRADALAAYDVTRRRLADELGIDPSAALQRLHTDLLRDDGALAEPQPARPQRIATLRLPALASSFVGREREVERLRSLLSSDRIVTITGPGGVGKTRLAIEVTLREHTDRPDAGQATFVALGSVVDPGAVPAVTATALGIERQGQGSLLDAITAHLSGRPARLVIDNAEHLVDTVAELVVALTASSPQLAVLTTSREPLGVDGEVVWPLDTLPLPPDGLTSLADASDSPAVRLLLDRIAAAAPDVRVSDPDVPAIVRLVREVDGLPLAIELAAARARTLSVTEIAERLGDRFALLSGGRRGAPARHRALAATLEWSWDLLSDRERRAWMAASVPAGELTADRLATVLAVVDPELDPLDALTMLTERSLVRVLERGQPTRYELLSSIREFGLRRLAESDLEEAARTAHADATEVTLRALDRTDEERWDVDVDGQRRLLPEVRAAIRWRLQTGDQRGAQRLAAGLGWLCYLTALTAEGRRLLDLTLGPIDELEPSDVEPQAVLWAAGLRIGDASPDGSRWAAIAAQTVDDPVSRTLAQGFCTAYRVLEGDLAGALELAEREASIGGWLEGMWRLLQGKLFTFAGRLEEAQDALGQGQRLLRTGASWSHLLAGDTLVQLAQLRGDLAAVRRAVAEGVEVCRRHDAAESELELQCLLAMAEAAGGADDRAAAVLVRCHELLATTSLAMAGAMVAQAEAYVAFRAGRDEVAERRWRAAIELHHWTGFVYGRPFAWWGLAHLALRRGDHDEAGTLLDAALEDAAARQDPDAIATSIEGHAAHALAIDDPERAAALLGAAAARRAAMGAPGPLITGSVAATTRARLRDQLGSAALDRAEREGSDRALDDLVRRG